MIREYGDEERSREVPFRTSAEFESVANGASLDRPSSPVRSLLDAGATHAALHPPLKTRERSSHIDAMPSRSDLLKPSRDGSALIVAGIVSVEGRKQSADVPLHQEVETSDDAPPEMDAGAGGNKPPTERPPRGGASEPEEPSEGEEGSWDVVEAHGRPVEVVEGVVCDIAPAEKPPRPVEIHHGERHDVITNLNHPDPELARQVAEQVKNGIPESWVRLYSPFDRSYYADSAHEPTLFAKTRHSVNVEEYGQSRDEVDTMGLAPEEIDHESAMIRAEHSVLNEMAIAPKVRDALQEEAVQQLVQEYGYASLEYVEPLAAISDRETGEKTRIYTWQSGFAVQNERVDRPVFRQPEIENVEDIVVEVGNALIERGIMPNDLHHSQFLEYIDDYGAKHLRLVDAERFARLTPAEREEPPEFERGLAPGEVEYYQGHQWYEVDAADVDTQRMTCDAPQNGMVAGRRNEADIAQSPVLRGKLEGGRAVAIWNERGEGAIVHFSRGTMEEEDAHFHALDELIGKNPTLLRANVKARVIGDEVSSPRPMSAWFANAELLTALEELGIADRDIISKSGLDNVTLRLDRGVLELRDSKGKLISFDDIL